MRCLDALFEWLHVNEMLFLLRWCVSRGGKWEREKREEGEQQLWFVIKTVRLVIGGLVIGGCKDGHKNHNRIGNPLDKLGWRNTKLVSSFNCREKNLLMEVFSSEHVSARLSSFYVFCLCFLFLFEFLCFGVFFFLSFIIFRKKTWIARNSIH